MASSFLNPTSLRVPTVPAWYGPVLPRVTNFGAPLALINPFVTPDPQRPGPIFPAALSYHASIISSLNMLFGTVPGERLFLPAYGLNMELLVFEALDTQMVADAQNQIRSAVERFEPRVQVLGIAVNKDPSSNAVSFLITMQVRGSTPNDLFTYATPSTPSA